jgi:transcriptional regulator with GAF, ATPase, and Fis domain
VYRKDLIAKAIHLASDRKEKPFVAINCAACPSPFWSSNLFGHEKRAFSGAIAENERPFPAGPGRTIFLDQIGDMPLSIQARYCAVTRAQEDPARGCGKKVIDVDVRIVTATNKNLEEQVRLDLFREDLYYRIHVIPIQLPP